MDKALVAISDILKRSMGLDYNSIGISSIESGVRKRIAMTGLHDYATYLQSLKASDDELSALIEDIVIPETWFFRDEKPYALLTEHLTKLRSDKPDSRINLLSLPSSTGEEPYSIAMTLTNLGWPKNKFNIDAYDISNVSIRKAKEGVYSKNSFRINDTSYIERYFTQDEDRYLLSEDIKACVNFKQGNMFDPHTFEYSNYYDVIFCRNLIIYFDSATQQQAFIVLDKLLNKEGILILGHAETAKAAVGKFTLDDRVGAYLYKKSTPQTNADNGKSVTKRKTRKISSPVSRIVNTAKSSMASRPADNPAPTPPLTAVADKLTEVRQQEQVDTQHLERIAQLANAGEILQGIDLCHMYLETNEKDANANYLMAVLHDAIGDTVRADEYLRKTIYLDPDHVEAIIHTALIAEKHGDIKTAERMRARAKRAEERRNVKMDKLA